MNPPALWLGPSGSEGVRAASEVHVWRLQSLAASCGEPPTLHEPGNDQPAITGPHAIVGAPGVGLKNGGSTDQIQEKEQLIILYDMVIRADCLAS